MTAKQLALFLAKVKVDEDGCWNWTAFKDPDGYARVGRAGANLKASRVAYAHWRGPIPPGHHVDHLCRIRACVNPAHLEAVTPAENQSRRTLPKRTHCIRGHEFTVENTYVAPKSGKRQCRACWPIRDLKKAAA